MANPLQTIRAQLKELRAMRSEKGDELAIEKNKLELYKSDSMVLETTYKEAKKFYKTAKNFADKRREVFGLPSSSTSESDLTPDDRRAVAAARDLDIIKEVRHSRSASSSSDANNEQQTIKQNIKNLTNQVNLLDQQIAKLAKKEMELRPHAKEFQLVEENKTDYVTFRPRKN